MTDLVATARSLFVKGKGLLAADESVHTADARLESFGITPRPGSGQAGREEMRRQDRALFLEAPGIEQYLSGVILFAETFDEKGSTKKLFPKQLIARGIAVGIKVDEGTEPLAASPKETITKGLFGLPERFKEFRDKGATFAKWRAVIHIDGDQLPTAHAIHENMKRLANYAREAQEFGLVPIIEPEVLHSGKHSRRRAEQVLEDTLGTLFSVLEEHAVDRASVILKTSMALSGSESKKKDTPEEVAESTLDVLLKTVPKQIAGIVFLSGGQTPDQATDNLAAIARAAAARATPWPLTFSYARALQEEALAIWKGDPKNVPAARAAYLARLEKVAGALNI